LKFTILSHACLHVEQDDVSLLVDPWLRGSAYWRSWWNFPPVNNELIQGLRPTHIFITHIHWDHFHGPSLRLYSKDTPILIPEDRYDRMARDLHAMGFKNVTAVAHGRELALGPNLAIRPYLFLPMTDTALMIYSPQVALLDANDCKICGPPLSQLLRDFPRVDFAFRSHSSANSRVCHEYLDRDQTAVDDREQYLRSFCNFMRAVQPRYAVPFASNHCHLHRDSIHFNEYIQTPLDVAAYFDKARAREGLPTELKVMLPGSAWSEQEGFSLADTAVFSERESELQRYLLANQAKLESYYATEAKVVVTTEHMRAFFQPFLSSLPLLVRWMFRRHPIVIVAEGGAAPAQWQIDLFARTVEPVAETARSTALARMHIPAIVLRQSLRMNMFGHAAISKRVFYRATAAFMPHLNRFEALLRAYELEFLPLRRNLSVAAVKNALSRWRELVLYVQVAVRMILGQKPAEIEQRLLLHAGARRSPYTRSHSAEMAGGVRP
jgi:UDP-MurNAc hydroxylase